MCKIILLFLSMVLFGASRDLATVIVCDLHDQTGTMRDIEDVCALADGH